MSKFILIVITSCLLMSCGYGCSFIKEKFGTTKPQNTYQQNQQQQQQQQQQENQQNAIPINPQHS